MRTFCISNDQNPLQYVSATNVKETFFFISSVETSQWSGSILWWNGELIIVMKFARIDWKIQHTFCWLLWAMNISTSEACKADYQQVEAYSKTVFHFTFHRPFSAARLFLKLCAKKASRRLCHLLIPKVLLWDLGWMPNLLDPVR